MEGSPYQELVYQLLLVALASTNSSFLKLESRLSNVRRGLVKNADLVVPMQCDLSSVNSGGHSKQQASRGIASARRQLHTTFRPVYFSPLFQTWLTRSSY
jgi:hypothetical protein